jgi:plastocyanin
MRRIAVSGRLATAAALAVAVAIVLAGGLVASVAPQTSSRGTASGTTFSTDSVIPSSAATSISSSSHNFPSTTTSTTASLETSATSRQSTPTSSSSSTSTRTTSVTTTSTTTTRTSHSSTNTTTRTTTTISSSSSSLSETTTTTTGGGFVEVLLPYEVGDNMSLNFQPANIKVVIGVNNTIVWNDTDFVQHNIESKSIPAGAEAWNSGTLNQGQTYTMTLVVPGNYTYYCEIHPWMLGTIEVVA